MQMYVQRLLVHLIAMKLTPQSARIFKTCKQHGVVNSQLVTALVLLLHNAGSVALYITDLASVRALTGALPSSLTKRHTALCPLAKVAEC